MLQGALALNASQIIAVPRIDLLQQHVARLREMSSGETEPLIIVEIHSRQPGERGKVERRLRDALDAATSTRTLILTTHTALIGQEPQDIEGWHIRWDELPEADLVSGKIGLGASWPALAALYDLVPSTEPGWFRLVLRREAIGLRQVLGDVGRDLVELHRLAGSRGRIVEVNIGAWEDAEVPGCEVQWRSIWSLAMLRGCASLQVAAAGYKGSLAEHAVQRAGGVRVEVVPVGAERSGQPQIRIYFYTRQPASTAFWAKPQGAACLVAISRHLESSGFGGYWAANDKITPYFVGRIGGEQCSPKLAGTNSLRHHVSAALFYSAKATPNDTAIMDALGLSREAIRTAREDQDILQFATRGAIRDADFDGLFQVRLYDEGQAQRLQARLIAGGYTNVMIIPVPEAGIMDAAGSMPGSAPAPGRQPETAAERDERKRLAEVERGRRRRAKAKNTQIANGTYRGRGRPRRSS